MRGDPSGNGDYTLVILFLVGLGLGLAVGISIGCWTDFSCVGYNEYLR